MLCQYVWDKKYINLLDFLRKSVFFNKYKLKKQVLKISEPEIFTDLRLCLQFPDRDTQIHLKN